MSGIFTPKECECPLDHSIVKLGHCRTCPYYGTGEPAIFRIEVEPGCGPRRHKDSTPHNFEYATYADDRGATGVCGCGLDAMTESIWEGP